MSTERTCTYDCEFCRCEALNEYLVGRLKADVLPQLRQWYGGRLAIARVDGGVPLDLDLRKVAVRRRKNESPVLSLTGEWPVWGCAVGGALYERSPRIVDLIVRDIYCGRGGIICALNLDRPDLAVRYLWPEQRGSELFYVVTVRAENLGLLPKVRPRPEWTCPECGQYTQRGSVLYVKSTGERLRTCLVCHADIDDTVFLADPQRLEPLPDHFAARVISDGS